MGTNNIRYERTDDPVGSIEIAEHLGREHYGREVSISGFASLHEATADDLAFCRDGYEKELRKSDAGVVITSTVTDNFEGRSMIYSPMPQADFVAAVHDFLVDQVVEEFIHPATSISDDAEIGDNCIIERGVTVGPDVIIGDRCVLGPGVTIGEAVSIGDSCILGPGTSIGQPGFGYQLTADGRAMNKIHEGTVVIEDDVHLGANCSVDRATFDETRIGAGSKLHNLCNLAHNVELGPRTRASPGCHFAGSTSTGVGVRLHPHVVIGKQVTIQDHAEVGANSTVLDDVPEGSLVVGSPAAPIE